VNAITGMDGHYLEPYIIKALHEAKSIRLIISFVMESGVKILLPHLVQAANNGVSIQLLTGRYLSVTEPSAIYLLYDYLGDSIDIRFYSDPLRSFHPKAYIFEFEYDSEIYVGSSNLSRSALISGVEWNYRLSKSQNPKDYYDFSNTFNNLFNSYSEKVTLDILKEYAFQWKRPEFVRLEDLTSIVGDTTIPEPRGAQIEALYYLKQARNEGISKGVVVAATGVGKTHLAAFDTADQKTVLFLAHRDEILQQAFDIFSLIRPESVLGFYNGIKKDEEAEIYFASVQTLVTDKLKWTENNK